jgi:hydrogenase expression/formation protein HypC
MCLGIPGKLTEIYTRDELPMGKADFGGILKEVCLAYTPEVQIGQYVLVHVGFAISVIDEAEAVEIFSLLQEMETTKDEPTPGEPTPGKAAKDEAPLNNPAASPLPADIERG